MLGLKINGATITVPGVVISNSYTLPPKCGHTRKDIVQHVVIHTTGGIDPIVRPQTAPKHHCHIKALIRYWQMSSRHVGAHIVIDADGVCYSLCDLQRVATHHATSYNGRSIGIEIVQQRDGSIYESQLNTVSKVTDAIVNYMRLPRTIALPYRGARDVSGITVVGHRDLSDNRGTGDPGDVVMQAIASAGQYDAA